MKIIKDICFVARDGTLWLWMGETRVMGKGIYSTELYHMVPTGYGTRKARCDEWLTKNGKWFCTEDVTSDRDLVGVRV